MDTHIMDEFPLQKAYRFQSQEVVKQEGVWVFQGTDNAPGEGGGKDLMPSIELRSWTQEQAGKTVIRT